MKLGVESGGEGVGLQVVGRECGGKAGVPTLASHPYPLHHDEACSVLRPRHGRHGGTESGAVQEAAP